MKNFTKIFKLTKLRKELKITPIRKPLAVSRRTYSKYPKLKAAEYVKIVNGSFGNCSHPLSPYTFVRQKHIGKEPKNWKCKYLKAYITKNIDFT